jgi:hypothetical protein
MNELTKNTTAIISTETIKNTTSAVEATTKEFI